VWRAFVKWAVFPEMVPVKMVTLSGLSRCPGCKGPKGNSGFLLSRMRMGKCVFLLCCAAPKAWFLLSPVHMTPVRYVGMLEPAYRPQTFSIRDNLDLTCPEPCRLFAAWVSERPLPRKKWLEKCQHKETSGGVGYWTSRVRSTSA